MELNLWAALESAAAAHPEVRASFPSEKEDIGYGELAGSARALAGGLIAAGVRPGEPVGVLCPNAPEFFRSVFGVLAAGAAACPLALPFGLRDLGAFPERLGRIAAVAGMRTIVVSHRFADLIERLGAALPGIRLIRSDLAGEPGELPVVGPEDLAIVQFTSGSTALPKGVRLTHRNVLSGLRAIREGIELGPEDGGGFWLPMFHDMGLFGALSAILNGIPLSVWSPVSFIKNPARWLREFTASGATITAMPSFGYDLLAGTVAPTEAAEFDLRRWRIAFNGAEPISRDAISAFCARFAPAGFRPEAMFCVYGMAEATLAVTFPPLGRRPVFEYVDRDLLGESSRAVVVDPETTGARAVAGVGRPVAGMELRIDAADGVVGEILIRGESVTAGYLGGDESFPDGWLRTGDLGYRREGEVFVTGRLKEMITVRGANFYPQDVEAIARTVHGVYKGRCAAVAGDEEIMLIAETGLTGAPAAALARELRRRVSAELGLTEVAVHLVKPRAIPRTSSGKVQRLATRELVSPHTKETGSGPAPDRPAVELHSG